MNHVLTILLRILPALALTSLCLLPQPAAAFPPAPPHEIYGIIRGQNGDPIQQASARIILETPGGVQVTGRISPGLAPGINYRLNVPMDAGNTSDPYIANALAPNTPFYISVIIGTTTYLPIEMTGDFSHMGEPARSTRIDLTLGVDSDGDGLPDAWEQLVISQLGGGLTLADITPDGDSDNDGLSNHDEYIAGTYAFDKADTFALVLQELRPDAAVFKFLVIRNRFYEIQRSKDLKSWTTVPFRIVPESATLRTAYLATDFTIKQAEVPHEAEGDTKYYYRGKVR